MDVSRLIGSLQGQAFKKHPGCVLEYSLCNFYAKNCLIFVPCLKLLKIFSWWSDQIKCAWIFPSGSLTKNAVLAFYR